MQFDEAGQFSEGLAAAKVNGKFGYIDTTGRFLIAPSYEQAAPFSDGLAMVRLHGLYGFIDKAGQLVIPAKYKEAVSFSEGLAAVLFNPDKWEWAFIDRAGKEVISPRVNAGTNFSNGLAKSWSISKKASSTRPVRSSSSRSFRAPKIFRRLGLGDAIQKRDDNLTSTRRGRSSTTFPSVPGRRPIQIILSLRSTLLPMLNGWNVLRRHRKPPPNYDRRRPCESRQGLSTTAYVRLGVIGSAESLAAIKRIEDHARKIVPVPPRSTAGDFIHPVGTFRIRNSVRLHKSPAQTE
jgi:hypothetical protein